MRKGKKYQKVLELVDSKKVYELDEAVNLLKKTSTTKFDSTCEAHFKLGVDVTKADQLVRSTVELPYGTGKKVRVIAFVNENQVKEAKEAGAIDAGLDELIEKISKGFLGFDVAVASPDVMKNLGKIAKILGIKGLMPNPKAGTVTTDISNTIKSLKKGRVEFRTDKLGQIHNSFGKVSFTEDQLKDNLKVLLKAIYDAKPAAAKGTFIQKISLATTMGPGIILNINTTLAALK